MLVARPAGCFVQGCGSGWESPSRRRRIPLWDALAKLMSMTTQIAVRLPDALVQALDELVRQGEAPSRASVVTSAVERELRRRLGERDARILAELGPQNDLDPLVEWTVHHTSFED